MLRQKIARIDEASVRGRDNDTDSGEGGRRGERAEGKERADGANIGQLIT